MESENPQEETITQKRGRGRPKKEKLVSDEAVIVKPRGRPRKIIDVSEIREKLKRGPKTSLTQDPEYYNNYYREHYKGMHTTCPACKNPNVSVDKVQRHIKTRKCWYDEMCCKFIKTEDTL